MRSLPGLALLVVAVALAGPAAAHIALISPPSRYGPDVLKEGPCGVAGGGRSDHVTELEPGAQIEITWDEYVNHPGHFRIAFDADGDDDFVDPICLSHCNTTSPEIEMYSNETVLLDGIADTPDGGESSATVTLPDVECDRCTLQVIQVMYDKPPYVVPGNDIYYQCADLVLRRATVPPPPCPGDCNLDGRVSVDELIVGTRILLGTAAVGECSAIDSNDDGEVRVDEFVLAVASALHDCESAAATPP